LSSQLSALSPDARIYRDLLPTLELYDGVLMRRIDGVAGVPERLVTVLPEKLRVVFVKACHLIAGHQGRAKTGEHVGRRCYFPRWRTLVAKICSECSICATYCRGEPPRHGGLQLQEVTECMARLAIDLTGPHPPTKRHNQYILTVTECFTRYLVAVPIRNRLATTVAAALNRYVFCVFGLCREIVSDQGAEFNGKVMKELLSRYKIRKLRTTFVCLLVS
jgi:Integrase core domain/Integrase zinc binding domain